MDKSGKTAPKPGKPSTTPASPAQPSQPEARPETSVKAPDFHNEVRGILETSCVSCHGVNDQKGGLRLDTLAFAKQGGDSGPAVVPGNKIDSTLLERIHLSPEDDEIMPPKTVHYPKSIKMCLIVGLKLELIGQQGSS